MLLYFLFIHFPSTGTLHLNCIAGINLHESLAEANVPVVAANGSHSARFIHLGALPEIEEFEWTSRIYPNWRQPGPWVSAEVLEEFLSQSPSESGVRGLMGLVSHLGPCEANSLLMGAAMETVVANPLQMLLGMPGEVYHILAQRTGWLLPHVNTLEFRSESGLPFPLKRAWSVRKIKYRGTMVWPQGMAIHVNHWRPLNALKWLVLPALAWALVWRRSPLFTAAAFVLLAWLFMIGLADRVETRIYAPLLPLWPLLIGGMLASLWQRTTFRRGAGPESDRP